MLFPKLKNKALLSPMAGITDVAFRALCKKLEAGLTYTEFVHSTALVRGSQRTEEMLATDKIEKPVAVQLFGDSVKDVVEAARLVEDRFDIIDINCGCPAWKVIKTGAGSALLNNPQKISTFVNKLVSAINKPVTVKIRTGIDQKNINALEVARAIEDAGAAALAIHGRSQKQARKGKADWKIIKKVKESVNIPVIGNGDVFSPETFKQRITESGVDYIMIARGAIGNPGLFTQINEYMKTGTYKPINNMKLFSNYLTLAKKHKVSLNYIKGHAIQFTKGQVGGSELRGRLVKCKTLEEIKEVMDRH